MRNRWKVTICYLPINSLFLITIIQNLIDEEIHALFIDKLCLRTLDDHTSDVVKASILRTLQWSSVP